MVQREKFSPRKLNTKGNRQHVKSEYSASANQAAEVKLSSHRTTFKKGTITRRKKHFHRQLFCIGLGVALHLYLKFKKNILSTHANEQHKRLAIFPSRISSE